MFFSIYNAQYLLLAVELLLKLAVAHLTAVYERCAAEKLVQAFCVFTYFTGFYFRNKKAAERGLRGAAKYGGASVIYYELRNSPYARHKVFTRYHLRFVEDNDTVCYIVQLAAF